MKRIIRTIAQKLYKRYRSYKSPRTTPAQANKTTPKAQYSHQATSIPPEQQDAIATLDIDIIPSPNPNACKYELSIDISKEAFSFSDITRAQAHPLAYDLFSLEGVHSVFGFQNFITVKKHPQAQWADLHPQVEELLQKTFGSQE